MGTGASIGVQLAQDDTNATTANANFTFGDGSGVDANFINSNISVGANGFTVDTIGLNAASGTYNFEDVAFIGNADLVSAGTATFVSQAGGALTAGTFGLSHNISTISVFAAETQADTNQTFTFVSNNTVENIVLDGGGAGNHRMFDSNGAVGTVTIQNITAQNAFPGTVFRFDNFNGTATLQNNTINVGGRLISAIGGTGNITITRGTGTAFTTRNVVISSKTGGSVVINGDLILNGGGVNAIVINNNTNTTVTFNGQVDINNTLGSGVLFFNNTTSTANFFGGLEITTTEAIGFSATGDGTIAVANAGVEQITTTGTGQALILDGVTVAAGGITFDSVTTAATANAAFGEGIVDINNAAGGVIALTTVNLAGTTTSSGLDISGNARASNVVVSGGTVANGVRIDGNGSGTVQIDANITENAGYTVQVANRDGAAGAITVNGTVTGGTGTVNIAGNSGGNVTFNGVVTGTGSNSSGAINIDNTAGGTVTFAALVDIDVTGNGVGIALGNNSAAINFNATTDINVVNGTAVQLTGTNAGLIKFANLDIGLNGNNSTGFDASGAVINANVTATDFDLTSTSTTGTTGVDLAGSTGTTSNVLGELNTNGGVGATIAG